VTALLKEYRPRHLADDRDDLHGRIRLDEAGEEEMAYRATRGVVLSVTARRTGRVEMASMRAFYHERRHEHGQ
jgi:hypothetical protein